MTEASDKTCFHCGLPVPPGAEYRVEIDGKPRAMCCPGCKAVAESILAAGLEDFYRYREGPSQRPDELVPEALREAELYDRPELQQAFVRVDEDQVREAALILEGITCAACVWLNERHLRAQPGVLSFQVNYSTRRARVRWDDSRIHLSDIIKAIAAIGYLAHPFDPGRQEEVYRRERRQALKRVAVAGLGAMQVMMLAVGLYAGEYQGMEARFRDLLRWVSLLIATPVVLYSARVFFTGAWRDLRRRRLGMDVPVALAVGSAYLASLWHTLTGGGEVYFDSATMFTFFLLTGRYLEMGAQHRAGQAAEELVRLLPAMATRLLPGGGEEEVPVTDLVPGDRVRVKPGQTVPADGRIESGRSALDESLLTGESHPLARGPGDRVVGGTLNTESPLVVRVEQVGEATVLSAIQRLLDRAQAERPPVARLADRAAGWFVGALLLLALAVGLYWLQADPGRAFAITLSVLVITCPCALSLATPVAVTAATGALTRLGVLPTRGEALETLARASHMAFDKTGTLTRGELGLSRVQVLRPRADALCRRVAAALEQQSEHPLARPFAGWHEAGTRVGALQAVPGEGLEAEVDGRRYRLGTAAFVAGLAGAAPADTPDGPGTPVWLGDAEGPIALFLLEDHLRPDAATAVERLRELGLELLLLSGDAPGSVAAVARELGIADWHARLLPEDKLRLLRALQSRGAVVAMVGDGVNDAPVLAGAQVSVAMGSGTTLAAASADLILLSEKLTRLPAAVAKARQTLRIIRENLAWALVYNLCAVPLAAMGDVRPWMAALGMSLSSLLVVLNALRLRDRRRPVVAGSEAR